MSEDFRFEVIAAGFTGDSTIPLAALSHEDGMVRASALRALARIETLTDEILSPYISDVHIETRRTAVELLKLKHLLIARLRIKNQLCARHVQLHLVRLVMNEVFLQFLLRVPTNQQFAGVPFWLLHHSKVTK
jgi:hypothetical protein